MADLDAALQQATAAAVTRGDSAAVAALDQCVAEFRDLIAEVRWELVRGTGHPDGR